MSQKRIIGKIIGFHGIKGEIKIYSLVDDPKIFNTIDQIETSINQLKPLSYAVDKNGKISIGEVSIEKLALKYGTPLYMLCEKTIRSRMQTYTQALEKHYSNYLVLYASKALNCRAICKIAAEENLGIDVVSAGELYTVLSADFPREKIVFHGNNKSQEEINMAIENKIAAIVLDNLHDLNFISEYLKANPQAELRLLIRVTPGIECHTHEYIKTGKIDSKFGFNIEDLDTLIPQIQKLQNQYPGLSVRGLHAHIGSQIFETLPHRDTVKVFLTIYKNLKDKFGLELEDINIGGGLGIKYQESDDPPEIETWVQTITDAVKEFCLEFKLKLPRIMIEPGRSIVGSAGLTIYRVGNIKNIPGLRKYIAVDGGMADNPRPIMYQARYTAEIDGKVFASKKELVTVAGKYCESGDVLISDIELPEASSGDLLVVFSTGAYNYSMASNYNRSCKPAMLLVKDGMDRIIIKRETLEDLVRFDL